LVDLRDGHTLHRALVPTEAGRGRKHSLMRLKQALLAVSRPPGGSRARLSPIGVALAELVDLGGRIASHATLGWRTADVHRATASFGRAILQSDVHAAALAEARYGAGRRYAHFLYVTVGTGISCALVMDGEVYRGAHGHALAFASGPTAGPRRDQALEDRSSGPALRRRAHDRGIGAADPVELLAIAARGSSLAHELLQDAAQELAQHIAVLVNALDPQAVVMGGGLGSAPGPYFEALRASLPAFLYPTARRRFALLRASLGPYAGAIGAALCDTQRAARPGL